MKNVQQKYLPQLAAFSSQMTDDEYVVSIYHSSHTTNASDTAKSIKSMIMDAIRDEARLVHFPKIPLKISQAVIQILEDEQEEKNPAFAIFLRFTPELIEKSAPKKAPQEIPYLVIPLYHKIFPSVFIGKTLDILPLLEAEYASVNALILTLDAKHAQIFHLENQQLTVIEQLENPFLNFPEEPTVNRAPSSQGGSRAGNTHGYGTENFARRFELAYFKFGELAIQKLVQLSSNGHSWKQIVVFASSDHKEHLSTLLEKSVLGHNENAPLIGSRYPSSDHEVREFTQQTIRDELDSQLLSLAEQVVEYRQQYAVGWEEVNSAAAERRIDTLLIAPEAQQTGYLIDNTTPSTKPAKDALRVKNISPWLTNVVLETGGQVIPNNYIPQLTNAMIAAKLRW